VCPHLLDSGCSFNVGGCAPGGLVSVTSAGNDTELGEMQEINCKLLFSGVMPVFMEACIPSASVRRRVVLGVLRYRILH